MVFEYSLWWILPIILLSLSVAYFKFKKISKLPDIGFGIAFLISFLRFCVLFVLLALLLKPAVSFFRNIKEKPLLLIAQDNSASLLNHKDSLYYKNEYKEFLDRNIALLEEKFTVEYLTFGKNVQKNRNIDFKEHHTDIASVFNYISNNYTFRRPELVLLLSDGIYNTGINPRYAVTPYPVYTVCLGDTTEYPDVYIKNVESDKFNFIKTVFPIKADIAAIRQKGKTIKCLLKENGRTIQEKSIVIDSDNFLKEIDFEIEALQKGVIKYTVEIETGFPERTSENNKTTVYIHIIDNSGNISIWQTAPHPDIAAIVNALNVSGIYHSTIHTFDQPWTQENANLIVLHNPNPENPVYQQIITSLNKRKTALLYILTTPEAISAFARYGKDYSVNLSPGINEYATNHFNREFPYFEFTEQEINGLETYPPLIVPFGEIKGNAAKNMFTQKIKNTPTSNMIMGFYEIDGNRKAYFLGEGLWKWRLYSFKENGNHDLFNTLINKTVTYLSAKKSTERFIHDIKPLYDETEQTVINAELYNESYELINTPDVKMMLTHDNKEYNYLLNRNKDKYRIDLGNLRAGEYKYKLTANLKGELFEKNGIFMVRSQNPELNDIIADKQLLKEIAANSGGQAVELSHLEELVKAIQADRQFKITYKGENRNIDLSEIGLLGIILLLLICTEWFLLKYYVG